MISEFDFDLKVSPYSGIVTYRSRLEIVRNKSSYIGITKENENTDESFFFKSEDYFYNIKLMPVVPTSGWWKLRPVNDNHLIAYNGISENPFYGIQSTDGGNSWNLFYTYTPGLWDYFMGLCPFNESSGLSFIYGSWKKTVVFRYTMQGSTKVSEIPGYCVYLYKYKDSNTVYVIASLTDYVSSTSMNTYLISSVDNGQTWSKPICISNELSPESFFYFGDDKMVVDCTGLSNFYFESNDGGNNWSKKTVSNVNKIRSLHFVSKNIGFIKTGYTDSWVEKNSGHVFRTLNGGATWQQMTNEPVLGSRIYFIDENIGFLQDLDYGNGQILMETKDGGKTWKEILYPYPIVVPQ